MMLVSFHLVPPSPMARAQCKTSRSSILRHWRSNQGKKVSQSEYQGSEETLKWQVQSFMKSTMTIVTKKSIYKEIVSKRQLRIPLSNSAYICSAIYNHGMSATLVGQIDCMSEKYRSNVCLKELYIKIWKSTTCMSSKNEQLSQS